MLLSITCEQGVWEGEGYESTEYDRVVLILYFMGFSITLFEQLKLQLQKHTVYNKVSTQ